MVMAVSCWPASAAAEVALVSRWPASVVAVVMAVSRWPAVAAAEVLLVSISPRRRVLCAQMFAQEGVGSFVYEVQSSITKESAQQ